MGIHIFPFSTYIYIYIEKFSFSIHIVFPYKLHFVYVFLFFLFFCKWNETKVKLLFHLDTEIFCFFLYIQFFPFFTFNTRLKLYFSSFSLSLFAREELERLWMVRYYKLIDIISFSSFLVRFWGWNIFYEATLVCRKMNSVREKPWILWCDYVMCV